MPLLLGFQPDEALSIVAPAMYDLADRLSECPGFQRLADGGSIEESRAKIHVNAEWGPFDPETYGSGGETITIERLEQILLRANIWLRAAQPYEATEPLAAARGEGNCPDEVFTLGIELLRQIRKAEIDETDENAVMLDFIDCATSIVHKLHEVANRKSPIISATRLMQSPVWNDVVTQSGQGRFIYCWIEVDVGDGGDQ